MTRLRLLCSAFLAASLLVLLLATPSGGQGEDWILRTTCTTDQETSRDYVRVRATVLRRIRRVTRRVRGKRVRSFMTDQVPENGNNVVDRKDSARTNRDGVAQLQHEFNNYGNYRIRVEALDDGEVVARRTINFGVSDRESGKCDRPLPGGS